MKKQSNDSLFNEIAIEQVFYELLRTPDADLLLEQLGMTRADLRKLEYDDEISAALETRREAVTSTPWRLDYDDPQSEILNILYAELEKHIDNILRGIWNAVPYGYSILEAVYKQDGKLITWASIQAKPIEWFELKPNNDLYFYPLTGSKQLLDTQLKFFITVRNQSYRNIYGEALLSRIYWPWFFRHNGWKYWMRFIERFADPLLLGQVNNPKEWGLAMEQLGFDSVLGVSPGEEITAVTNTASGEFEKVHDALARRIQKVILGQTLTSDISGTGSYAAAQVHNVVRDDKRRADIQLIIKTVQKIINAFWIVNGFLTEPPQFIMFDDAINSEARKELADLTKSGIIKFTEKYYMDRYELRQDDFVISN